MHFRKHMGQQHLVIACHLDFLIATDQPLSFSSKRSLKSGPDEGRTDGRCRAPVRCRKIASAPLFCRLASVRVRG